MPNAEQLEKIGDAMEHTNHAHNLLNGAASDLQTAGEPQAQRVAARLARLAFELRDALSWLNEPGRDPDKARAQLDEIDRRIR